MEKKQSSVEWLVEQLTYENEFGARFNSFRDGVDLSEIIQQAKEKNREEIEEAYEQGCEMGEMFNNENRCFKTDAQQYYNETYKQ